MRTAALDETRADARSQATAAPWVAVGLLGGLVLAYVGLLIVRASNQSSTLIDGWGVDAVEFAAGALTLWLARRRGPGRSIALLFGSAVVSWALGDVAITILSLGGAQVPTPSIADVFYLGFFPLAYAGVALQARLCSPRLTSQYALDGAVAGLGAAALCAAVVFRPVAHEVHRSTLGTAVNLAYPVCDVMLLLVVVGGAAITTGSRRQWLLLGLAFAINTFGDTSNLLAATSHLGVIVNDAAWPASAVLIAAAMCLGPAPRDPFVKPRSGGFGLPGLAAGAGVLVLGAGSLWHVSSVATALATATLMAVLLRTVLSVRQLRAQTEMRHHQSRCDVLTGLGNRRRLRDVLDPFFAVPAAERPALAFLFIDLNGFKQVNDAFGHGAGDEILIAVAERLEQAVDPQDLAVRIGGDEFAVLLHGERARQAGAIAPQIGRLLSEPFELGGVRAELGASIGIADSTDCETPGELLEHADAAMYEAKRRGLAYAFYTPLVERGAPRLRLADELSTAINAGQLLLHYQPQLDLAEDRIQAVEALVRWRHPERGLIPPLQFLPLAEEAGLMGKLTRFVLSSALRQGAAWLAEGRPIRISVNVSVCDLLDARLPALVADLAAREGMPPSMLTIEITETTIVEEFDRARAAVLALREVGVEVSVDDFGAGFTSLAYLSELPVSEMKLDRRMIAPLAGGVLSRKAEVVRAATELGHALGLRVVAEGIEDDAALGLVRSLGCDLAQGYAISRPAPAGELFASGDDPLPHARPQLALTPPARRD